MPETLEGFRLSPQQERLWALARADSGWPLFSWALFEVEGELEACLLRKAVETLVASQEILRTEILAGPRGELVQTIADRVLFQLHVLEAGDLELEAWVESALREAPASSGASDLAVWLLRGVEGPSLLMLRASAFASDRQGLHNLAGALLRAYVACCDERVLMEEPVQYADVAEAFQQLLESEETRAGREHWHGRWPVNPLSFQLPWEPPSQLPDEGTFLSLVRSVLPPRLAARLEEQARLYGDSVEALVLACWLTALHGATGMLDLCVGWITNGRDFEGLAEALGPFSRCLPLRVQVRPRSGFGDLVHATGRELAQVKRFQDYFAAESDSFLPWVFESFSRAGIAEGDLGLRLLREQSTVDRFHLMLSMAPMGETLELALSWDTRVYGREVVEGLFVGLMEVLDRCAPSVPVGGLCRSNSLPRPLRAQAVVRPPIERADRSMPLQLSFAQQRLWFLHQFDPGSAAYNIPSAVGLAGDLDLAALSGSLREVVRRHEVLRTVFTAINGEPRQILQEVPPVPLPLVDLSGLDPHHQRAEVERLALAETERPFDLSQGPLLRSTVLRLGPGNHTLLTTMHHIVSDGWSMGIFSTEVTALYKAARAGRPSPLPELRIQYADFAAWQRSWLEGEVLEAELDYWRCQLQGAPPVLALPADRPRPPVAGSRGASRSLRLEDELSGALGFLAASQGATPFMVLLAGFASLLHRLTGETDLVVGTPIANRNHLETEGLIGFFVNTLALRCDLSGEPGFLDVLERVRDAALAAYAHQDTPFERLVAELAPERSLSYTPLFQVMLSLQNASRQAVESADLAIAPVEADAILAKFDLDLGVSQVEGRLIVGLVYRSDLFDPASAARFLGYFEGLLAAGVSTPSARLSDLPVLSAAERWQMLGEWCDTEVQASPDLLLHQLFEMQVRRAPGRVAVVCEEECLSYRSLNHRANRLARRLRELGVGVDDRVGICAERSFELVVGLLAILKAGAAYLPLDADYPADRLAFVAKEALGPDGVVLSKGSLPPGLDGLSGLRQVALSMADPEPLGVEGEDLALPVPAEAAAYVLYTSGSTGRPKGVVNCHRAIVNRILWGVEVLSLGPEDRYLQKAPINFDVSVMEIFAPLAVGAPVTLARPGGHRDPAYLMEVMECAGITLMGFVPSLLQAFLEEGGKGCGSLRLVLSGGEALPFELEQRSLRQFGCAMYNQYGPTETAVNVTVWRCRPSERERPVPIGRPMANTSLYVLDGSGSPLPLGVSGELYLGGAQLARGYLGRPDLTAERFVPDPFSPRPGGRLYRTGDLVRWSAVGDIEFFGRIDHQVKVRGVRIELGEIEAVLLTHPYVREAVVVPHGAGGNVRLAAYVVGREGHAGGAARLRDFLRASLPEPMVPAAFVFLPALPLTPSGKADRKALPAPGPVREAAGEPARPRGPVEDLVTGIWGEVLGLEEIGPDESFFDLGGHSLLAVRVISRTKNMLGVDLPLRVLFEEPTLAGFAERVDLALRSGEAAGGRVIERADRSQPLPLSFAQQRLWFLDQLEPDSPAYNIPSAVRLEGELDLVALARSLSEVVRRQEVLRTVFEAVGGEPRQVIRPASPLSIPLVDLSGLGAGVSRAEAERLALEEARRPFDLARGPLLRSTVLRLGPREHVALETMHHIVSDGWSMGIFNAEMGSLYQALSSGGRSPLPEPPIQYADFAVWQRRWLSGQTFDRMLGFWRQHLAGAPPVLELPADRPRPALQSWRGAVRYLELPVGLSRALRELRRRREVTLFALLLSAFQALLARWSGQPDLSIGTPVAGRNRLEVEGIIGLFVNTLVLRADLSGDPGFRELLERTWRGLLEAYAYQDMPFEKLVEELVPERSLSRSPLFQVMFALQNVPRQRSGASSGLRSGGLAIRGSTAAFDLTLALSEEGELLAGGLEYSTDLFDGTTIARLLIHFQNMLQAIVDDSERPVSSLPMLAEWERSQLTVEWNAGAVERFGDGLSAHELFMAQAAQTPEAVALVSEQESLSYGELDCRSNQWARRLRSLGAGPGTVVGICLDRCAEMIVAVFGVLKAGAAYLPLDLSTPRQRLQSTLADAGVVVLVTRASLGKGLEAAVPRILDPESDFAELAAESGAALPARRDPEELAYVIYTSGSTGTPRGVLIKHGSLAAYARTAAGMFGLAPGDRVLQFASLAFDASAEEIFPCLIRGATLILRPEGMLGSGARFAEVCGLLGLTVLDLPTAFWHELTSWLETGEAVLPASVRLVVIGGEQALRERVAAWRRTVGDGVRLLNTYGPTETTIVATAHEPLRSAGPEPTGAGVSIGTAISGSRAHVLDRGFRPVPIGAAGELVLGGAGVARGYLGRPDLTAERFLPDPFGGVWEEPGSRLYRTGDLARFLADGRLEFLGRIDHQVKVRGFRVELGEIESALRAHGGVREAVVVAREDEPGNRRLVGYVVAETEVPGLEDDLRSFLRDRLPEYMVPSAVVQLPRMPLTSGGKVDRRALPAPKQAAPRMEGLHNPLEEILAGIWSEVLGTEGFGSAESFFDLGGHSLLATRVLSRVRAVFGVELPVRTLFEASTVAAFAGRIDLALRGGGAVAGRPIERTDRSQPLPLSFAQERLWFLHQLDPDSPAYNIPVALLVLGDLHLSALERSLGEVVRRHESLRTVFETSDGEPWQVIRPASPFLLPVVDLSGLEEDRRRAEAAALVRDEAQRPFDLARGPLLRAFALALADREHAVLLTQHHVISDGWSVGLLSSEALTLYEACREGRASPLPELPVQYADFAVWQRRWLDGEVLDRELAFWRRCLAGGAPVLELPADRPRPAVQTLRGTSRPFVLVERDAQALHRLSRGEGTTLFMTLLAALQVLLWRLTGEPEVRVGTPVAGRSRLETEGLIGCFVNTLVLQGDLTGDPSFRDVLVRAREGVLEAHAHQDLPFEKLVEELSPERSLSHSVLFQVMLLVQEGKRGEPRLPGTEVRRMESETTSTKFDLTVALADQGGRLGGSLEYSADLFDPATVQRWCGYMERLLSAVASDASLRVSELPLLSEPERWHLLGEWGGVSEEYPPGLLLHELFEAQARRTPGRVAVVYEGQRLSYRSLNRRANGLARRLRELGVGLEERVGVFAERSLELVVGLLAVLKAGAAYLPLDPDHPSERLAFLTQEGLGPEGVVLVQGSLPAGLARLSGLRQVPLSVAEPEPAGAQGEDLSLILPAEAAAYVLYTSGSTGHPKGVVNHHRGIVNRMLATRETLGARPEDRCLQKTPISFDISLAEIFSALTAGACLVMARPGGHRDPAYLREVVEGEGVTMLSFVPSLLHAFLEEEVTGCGSLRLVASAGEALSFDLEQQALRQLGCAVYNHYGPTEAAIDVTVWRCRPSSGERPVPIGRASANTSLYVLDASGLPVPLGAWGELSIGGVQVARGYLGRADLTAERFVPDPFSSEPGARLYRTGDLVRWSVEGEVEYLGRIDNQVKVRGVRIELGEIEAALRSHPGVREAVVAPHGSGVDVRLAAYVVAREGSALAAGDLRDLLRASLPEAMVPSSFLLLETLPRTTSGKVDRKALPPPETARERALSAPRDMIELRLVIIWEEILGTRNIGVQGDFFALGGHSLLATRLLERIRRELKRDLPLSVLFEAPTIQGLARLLRKSGPPRDHRPLVPIWPRGPRLPFFCVHPIGGNVLCYLELSQALGADQPFFGLQAPLAGEGPWSVEDLATRYVEAVRELQPHGPYFLGGWSMGGTIAFDMARRLTAEGEQVRLLALIDSYAQPSRSAGAAEEPLGKIFAQDMASLLGLEVDDAAWEGPDAEEAVLAGLLAEGQRRGLFPASLSFADVRDVFLVFKHNHQALRSHVPSPYSGRVELLRAEAGLARGGADPAAGWSGLAAGGVRLQVVPGDHYSMLRAPHVASLAARLRTVLEAATPEPVGEKR